MAEREPDDRFSKVFSDPRFRTLRKTDKTLKIDNRFKSMFTEDKFKLKYSMDKRGKSKKHLISEDYKKFYRLSDEDGDNEETTTNIEKGKIDEESGDNYLDNQKIESKDNVLKSNLSHKYGYHRGINYASDEEGSSSSSSSESEEDEDEEQELEHEWGELDKDAQQIEQATSRIAICNADWDRVNAQDLYVLINSFKRATGAINFVRVYYSKFGEERLKVEERKGPSEFIFGKGKTIENSTQLANDSNEDENDEDDKKDNFDLDDNDDGDQEENDEDEEDNEDNEHKSADENDDEEGDVKDSIAMEKLRKYQLERLKYFYAVVGFDSAETAEVIYNELDGMEYESSSTTLDIRFIPEDTDFDDVKLKAECTSMPNSTNYNAPSFINTALQQSNVKLTWDETDPKRKNIFDKAFDNNDNEDDLKAYLASSDDDFDQDEIEISADLKDEEKISKYKDLLKSLDNNKDDDCEMEVTWDPGLKSTAEDLVNKKGSNFKSIPTDNVNLKYKVKLNEVIDNSDGSDVGDMQNDLISDSEEELLKVKSDKSKDRYKKWKKNRQSTSLNSNEDSSKLELLMVDIRKDDQDKKHFNYKEIVDTYSKKDSKSKVKGTMQQEDKKDSFKFDSDDPRFNAIYTSHLYNVDQSDPNFKKTEAFDQILNKRKIKAVHLINEEKSTQPKLETIKPQTKSWMSLVRKVKDTTGEQEQKKKIDKTTQESRFSTNKKFRR